MCILVGCIGSHLDPDPSFYIEIDHHITILLYHKLPSITPCPDDMTFIPKYQYCIDTYEAPNQEGAYPFYAQSAYQAENYCQAHNKSLCTIDRWYVACVGTKKNRFPYGNWYRKGVCNDNKVGWTPVPWHQMGTSTWVQTTKRLYKGEPSGNRPACMSDYGVYDLTGNVAEWVKDPRSPHGYVVKGGYWYGVFGHDVPSCKFSNVAHSPNFNSYEFGFRCCRNIY